MICPQCKSDLGRISASGDPMLRARGLVLKAEGLVVICPKCKGDVPLTKSAMRAVHRCAVLFLRRPAENKS